MATRKQPTTTATERHRAALLKSGGRYVAAELDKDAAQALDVLLKSGETIRTAIIKALQRLAKDRTRAR